MTLTIDGKLVPLSPLLHAVIAALLARQEALSVLEDGPRTCAILDKHLRRALEEIAATGKRCGYCDTRLRRAKQSRYCSDSCKTMACRQRKEHPA